MKLTLIEDSDLTQLTSWGQRNQHAWPLAYPRWISFTELQSELALFQVPARDVIRRVIDHSGEHWAYSGWLFSPGDSEAFVIGPYVKAPDSVTDAQLVELLEALEIRCSQSERTPELGVASVAADNTAMQQALQQRNWSLESEHLEMSCDLKAHKDHDSKWSVRRPKPSEAALICQAAAVFGAHVWRQTDSEKATRRLEEMLSEGCDWAVIEHEGQVLGSVLWTLMPKVDFCRLEYVAVRPEARGRAVGTSLIDFVLGLAKGAGFARIYLDVNPENRARWLYERCGFENGLRSVVYRKRLKSRSTAST